MEEGIKGEEDERDHDFHDGLPWVVDSGRELVPFPGGLALTESKALDTWHAQGDSGGSVYAVRYDHRPVPRTPLQAG